VATHNNNYKTTFEIAGKYSAGPAFDKAGRDIAKVEEKAKSATVSFTKLFGSFVTGIMASHAAMHVWHDVTELFSESFDAALNLVKIQDKLRLSMERLADKGVLARADVEKQSEEFFKLAEHMEETGLKSETLIGTFDKLSKFLRPGQVSQMAKGYQDWMTKVAGGAPSLEKASELTAQLNLFIQKGSNRQLFAIGLTKEEIANMNKLTTARERAAWVVQRYGKQTGEYARWSKTIPGMEYEKAKALEAVHKKIGEGMIGPYKVYLKLQQDLYKALIPIAEAFSTRLTPALDRFNATLKENQPSIVKFFDNLGKAFIWIIDHWKEVALGLSGIIAVIVTFYTVSGVIAIISGIAAAIAFLATPIGVVTLALVALGGLILAVYENWNILGPYVEKFWNNLQSGATKAWEGITAIWDKAVEYFTGIVESIKNVFEPIYDYIIGPFKKAYDYIDSSFKRLLPNYRSVPAGGGGGGGAGGGGGGVGTGAGGREGGDYVPPWQQQNVTEAASTAAATVASNPSIAAERAKVMAQLQEPGMRKLTAAVISKEQGTSEGRADVLESLVNRAVVTGKHPKALMTGGFYGPVNRGEVNPNKVSDEQLKEYDRIAAQVAGGRNRILGRTDQGMANEIKGEKLKVAGEYYGFMGNKGERNTAAYKAATMPVPATGPKIEDAMMKLPGGPGSSLNRSIKDMNLQQRVEGGTGGQNVASNPVINIHGVPAGQEGAVGAEVTKAMANANRDMLSKIKSAKAYESRLGYV
jgi:hypothetical protein